ncbi:hypothetical protein [Legionella qingyii]|nr:hypothetical protein [Legionella qingyii]
MSLIVDLNHPIFLLKNKVVEASKNLLDAFGFNYFQYLRCFADGSINCLTNNTGLIEYFQQIDNAPVVFSSFLLRIKQRTGKQFEFFGFFGFPREKPILSLINLLSNGELTPLQKNYQAIKKIHMLLADTKQTSDPKLKALLNNVKEDLLRILYQDNN